MSHQNKSVSPLPCVVVLPDGLLKYSCLPVTTSLGVTMLVADRSMLLLEHSIVRIEILRDHFSQKWTFWTRPRMLQKSAKGLPRRLTTPSRCCGSLISHFYQTVNLFGKLSCNFLLQWRVGWNKYCAPTLALPWGCHLRGPCCHCSKHFRGRDCQLWQLLCHTLTDTKTYSRVRH